MQKSIKKPISYADKSLKKSRKVISIFVVLLLLSTLLSTIVTSQGDLSDENTTGSDESEQPVSNPEEQKTLRERLLELKEKIESIRNKFTRCKNLVSDLINNQKTQIDETNNDDNTQPVRLNILKSFITFLIKLKENREPLFIYTNYENNITETELKLFRKVPVDVNNDSKNDVDVKLVIYPYIEESLSLSINFKVIITKLSDFPKERAFFEAYSELEFPGILLKNQKGDKIKFGYESPEGEVIPDVCEITYKYLPHIFSLRKKPEHRLKLNPGSATDSKLVTLIGYVNIENETIESELNTRIIYNPAVRSEMKFGGEIFFGGRTIEYERIYSGKSNIDIVCSLVKNDTEIFGYVKDMPDKVTFTVDLGREGYIEFNTYGESPFEIGICDDYYNPVNKIYFTNLPTYARLEWDRGLLFDLKVEISGYTDSPGIALNGHFNFPNSGVFDFSIVSKEHLDFLAELDILEGYLLVKRSNVDLSVDLSAEGTNSKIDLSFDLKRIYEDPFRITFGKLLDGDVNISLATKQFEISNFELLIDLDAFDLGIKAQKILKSQSGKVELLIETEKDDENITFRITMVVENGLEIEKLSLGFNNSWTPPQNFILEGTVTRTFEILLLANFEYYIAEDGTWGYFYFKGDMSYTAYRTFVHNEVTGGFIGKLYLRTGSEGVNFSWYSVYDDEGNKITKLSISGIYFGLENFHFYFGEYINFAIPQFQGSIKIEEVCKDSGFVEFEIDGGQSFLDIDFSNNFSGPSDFNFTLEVDDFHIDIPDTSVILSTSWEEGAASSMRFFTDGSINLNLQGFDLLISAEEELLAIEDMTANFEAYAGFDVHLTLPFNQTIGDGSYLLDFSDDTFSLSLENVNAYLNIERVFILFVDLGRITVSADVTGKTEISLLNIYLENFTFDIYEDQVDCGRLNFTMGIDTHGGSLNLNLVEIEDLGDFLLLIGLEIGAGIKIENAYFSGYTKFIIPIKLIGIIPYNVGMRLENDPGTSIYLEKASIILTDILGIPGLNFTAYTKELLLSEGNFEVNLNFLLMQNMSSLGVSISEGNALQNIYFGAEILDSFDIALCIDSVDYLNLEFNNNFNNNAPPYNKYLLIDTKNTSTPTVNGIFEISSDFINLTIDYLNYFLGMSMDHVEHNRGIAINNLSFRADDFKIYLNKSAYPRISGYLELASEGNITILKDGEWEQILPPGNGFSLTITPGHIQIMYELALENHSVYWEGSVGESYVKIGGTFTVKTDNMTIDIFWNKADEYIEIITNIDKSLYIEDFIFTVDDKIEVYWNNLSFLDGEFTFLFNNNSHIIELQVEGSTVYLEQLDCNFNLNQDVTVDIGSLEFLGGKISISTVPGSQEWNVQTLKDINWFKLTDFDLTINNLEAGVGLIQWDKKTQSSFSATLDVGSESGAISIDRNCDLDSEFTVEQAFIKYTIPGINLPIGGKLRSFTVLYQKSGHEYFNVEWKKDEYLDIDADFAVNWNLSFERFFDVMNYIGILDMIGSSVDGNFSIHYVPPADNNSAHHLELDVHDTSSFALLEIQYKVALIHSRTLSIGTLEVQPGTVTFEWLLNEDKSAGWIYIDNDGVDVDFAGITLERDEKVIKFLEVSVGPGETYLEVDTNEQYIYIDNTAFVDLTLFSFSENLNEVIKLEKDSEIGVINMVPGEFKFEWENLTTGEYDKQFKINNGIFEFTVARLILSLGDLEVLFSIADTDGNYANDIIVKLRNRGNNNRAIFIDTEYGIQVDALVIGIETANWELDLDLLEMALDFDEFYIGYFGENLTYGGNVSLDINRFFNLTYRWKDQGGQTQELFLQYENEYDDDPQAQAMVLDTENCVETLDIDFATKLNELDISGTVTIKPQRYMLLHFDLDPTPYNNVRDGHLFIDTNNEEMGDLAIKVTKYISLLDATVGFDADISFLKADEFHIYGEFIQTSWGGWFPSDWGISGSIDVISIGSVDFVYNTHSIELWPCMPQAILDKSEYGVSENNPVVTFDTSQSHGFIFRLKKMRWDWDGDGSWDTGTQSNDYWIDYEKTVQHDFTDFINSGEESVEIHFQVKTLFATSNIASATVIKGYDMVIVIQHEGEKIFEGDEFTVVVTNLSNGGPVENAFVTFKQKDKDGNILEATNTTDANGESNFIAFDVPADYYRHYSTGKVYVEADGYLDKSSPYFYVYDKLSEVYGYVKDYVTRQGIGDALVEAQPGDFSVYTMNIGANTGYFKLLLPAGTYDITVTKDDFDTYTINDFIVEDGKYYNLGTIYLHSQIYGGIRGHISDEEGNSLWGATVTVVIPDGDDLVGKSSVIGNFPIGYPSYSKQYHAFDVSPGTYTVEFELEDYYFYSEDVTVVVGEITEMDVTLECEWVTPNGHNDPQDGWNDETNAYDDDIDTMARSKKRFIPTYAWTEYLQLTTIQIDCDKIRFIAWYNSVYCYQIDLDVFYDGGWHDVYQGIYPNNVWTEKSLGGTYSVSMARVRFYIKGYIPPWGTTADLYELDFHHPN